MRDAFALEGVDYTYANSGLLDNSHPAVARSELQALIEFLKTELLPDVHHFDKTFKKILKKIGKNKPQSFPFETQVPDKKTLSTMVKMANESFSNAKKGKGTWGPSFSAFFKMVGKRKFMHKYLKLGGFSEVVKPKLRETLLTERKVNGSAGVLKEIKLKTDVYSLIVNLAKKTLTAAETTMVASKKLGNPVLRPQIWLMMDRINPVRDATRQLVFIGNLLEAVCDILKDAIVRELEAVGVVYKGGRRASYTSAKLDMPNAYERSGAFVLEDPWAT